MGSNWKNIVAWLIVFALPWQALMAVTLDVQGPAHYHASVAPGLTDPQASAEAAVTAQLILPRDFTVMAGNSAHHHSAVEHHRHDAHGEDVVNVDEGMHDGDVSTDLSQTGGFGSVFAAMLACPLIMVPPAAGTCRPAIPGWHHASRFSPPLERPPSLPTA